MEYTTLGDTGTTVSQLCLGCMSFSEHGAGWQIDRETSIELGINFFDITGTRSVPISCRT